MPPQFRAILARWQADSGATFRHPHAAPDTPTVWGWSAVRVQQAVTRLATVAARADAGMPVTSRLDLRIRAAGFWLTQDAQGRWRATHEAGLITAWADDLPTLHGWLLATVPPTPRSTPMARQKRDERPRDPEAKAILTPLRDICRHGLHRPEDVWDDFLRLAEALYLGLARAAGNGALPQELSALPEVAAVEADIRPRYGDHWPQASRAFGQACRALNEASQEFNDVLGSLYMA